MTVKWRKLDGYSRYEISNTGLIKNILTNKLITGSVSQNYVYVTLYPDIGKQKPLRLHRLVATLFCPNENNYTVVNHKDGNTMNNNADNLEWVTSRQNTQHAATIGKIVAVNHRPVRRICPQTGETVEYPSVTAAYKNNADIVKHLTYIINVCSGRQKMTGGYMWEYVDSGETDIVPRDGKIITGYTNYLITLEGKIYSKKSRKFINPSINNTGYLIIDLNGDEYDKTKELSSYTRKRTAKRKKFRVHRLVAEYFIPNPNPKLCIEVNHKNKIRTDNRVENLEWVTRQQNLGHAHNKVVYQFTKEWELVGKYSSLNEAAQKTGINCKNISSSLCKGYPYTANGFYWTYMEPKIICENGVRYIILD